MTDVTLDRVCELLRNIIELLWGKPEGLYAREIIALLPELTRLSDYEREAAAPSHMPRYEKIVRLATIPLVNAGWLNKSKRGRWSLTDEGRQACLRYSNIQQLYKEALRLIDERGQKAPVTLLATEEAEELAWEQVQKHLMDMQRGDFQNLVMELLKAIGYHITWVAPPYKNRGHIDMVAKADPLGVNGAQIMVQVIHKGQPITLEGLRSFLSSLGAGHYGLLVSSGGFTKGIREEVQNESYEQVTLWDMENIFELWVRYYDDLDQHARSYLPIKAVYFLLGNATALNPG
ncbi:MAG: Mrr restriction system protein [Chloroflexota bacterium]